MNPLQVSTAANATLQNRMNISIVFHHIREYGPVYRAKIARDLRLSAPAVSRAVEALKSEGYVVESERSQTGNGKLAGHLEVNSGIGSVISVDLLKEPTKIAAVNLHGAITNRLQGFTISDSVKVEKRVIGEITDIVSGSVSTTQLKAISVGIPATVDEAGSVSLAPLYRSLQGLNLKASLEERFRVPVFVENIVKLSALAEAKRGAGRNYRSFVFVEIGNGIGAGIVVDRHVVRGSHGSAGEIGFILRDGESGSGSSTSGNYLEEYASLDAIRRRAVESVGKPRTATAILDAAGGRAESITAATVCEAAAGGDPVASEILESTTRVLARALMNLVLILDPDGLILGGDFVNLPSVEALFVEPIRKELNTLLPFSAPEIALSSLGEDAGILGGAQMAVDALLTGLYPYRMDS